MLAFGMFACASTSLDEPMTEIPKNETDRIQLAMSNLDFSQVVRLTADSKLPLLQLAHRRALYELENFDTILQSPPIADPRYASYDILLKALSAYDSKHWELIKPVTVPKDLPRVHREHIAYLKADAYRESGSPADAISAYKAFLKDYRGGAHETDAMFHLAELLWDQGEQAESLQVYEKIYKLNPLGDGDDIARQRLLDSGRYTALDADVHLGRIQKLQHAALFERAERELETLKQKVSPDDFERVDLAMAKLLFANRKYAKTEDAARRGLETYQGSKREADWRELLALSLTRQSKPEEGIKEYHKILAFDIPRSQREVILFRLGSIALDHQEFATAADYYKKVREQFDNGNFTESAHWFGAWSLYLEQKSQGKEPPDLREKNLKLAIDLTSKIPSLPSGQTLEPQALYWQAHFYSLLKDEVQSTATLDRLRTIAPLHYYSILLKSNPFAFLNEKKLKPNLQRRSPIEPLSGFRHEINWQRLEAFRSVGIQPWAQPELDIFLASSRGQSRQFQLLVADRLTQIQDWADLVKWADRYFEKPMKAVDLTEITSRYHYPLVYRDAVMKAAREFDISPFLIWGLMREESRFEDAAISRVGAVGLMQIMPSLGDRIGRSLGEGSTDRKRLADPKRNIRYGAFHLKELERSVNRLSVAEVLKPVLIVAAYNAGIEAVQRWLNDKDSSSVDLFVESIPFTETRAYVKRVLQSAYIYFQLYGDHDQEVARTRGKMDL